MNVKNTCEICGKPCRIKYCKDCRDEGNKIKQKEWRRGRGRPKFQGCDEDCANCPYPDCLKPVNQMKPTREVVNLREKQDEDLKSQGKMFACEIGKYNSFSPNPNRKAWF